MAWWAWALVGVLCGVAGTLGGFWLVWDQLTRDTVNEFLRALSRTTAGRDMTVGELAEARKVTR